MKSTVFWDVVCSPVEVHLHFEGKDFLIEAWWLLDLLFNPEMVAVYYSEMIGKLLLGYTAFHPRR
jgi:hypothetical protein